jgi:hypothetical protein
MSQKSDITSIAIPESLDNDQVVDLKNLQYDIAALAEYREMLTKLQKQRIRYNIQCEFEQGIQELSWLVECINTLSAQLETEIFKFKQIAVKTNKAYWEIQQFSNLKFSDRENLKSNYRIPHSIWQIHRFAIPIIFKQNGVFILTTKTLDWFLQSQEINSDDLAKESQKRRHNLETWLLKMQHL